METEHKIRNNNQISDIQANNTITSQHIGQYGECSTNGGVYICMPRIHAVYSMRSVPHYPKIKHNGKMTIVNHARPKSAAELTGNCIIYESPIEEPIDLTCTVKREVETYTPNDNASLLNGVPKRKCIVKTGLTDTNEFHQNNFVVNDNVSLRKRGRKRKIILKDSQLIPDFQLPTLESGMFRNLDIPDLIQLNASNYNDNRQAEVLKAAKSLFSKRTRTLYHWIYPDAPKAKLKAAVASSWETLGEQEKEFYISQVLGRFGFPQTNLMVNPQLGGVSSVLSLPPLDLTTTSQEGSEETSTAVSGLLMSESGNNLQPWMHHSLNAHALSGSKGVSSNNRLCYTQRMNRKIGRLGRPPGSKNRKQIKEEFPILKQIREEPTADEFQDDPELSREFQQFRWTLHLNDNHKA